MYALRTKSRSAERSLIEISWSQEIRADSLAADLNKKRQQTKCVCQIARPVADAEFKRPKTVNSLDTSHP